MAGKEGRHMTPLVEIFSSLVSWNDIEWIFTGVGGSSEALG